MKSYSTHKIVQYVSTVLQYKVRNDAELIKHDYYLQVFFGPFGRNSQFNSLSS